MEVVNECELRDGLVNEVGRVRDRLELWGEGYRLVADARPVDAGEPRMGFNRTGPRAAETRRGVLNKQSLEKIDDLGRERVVGVVGVELRPRDATARRRTGRDRRSWDGVGTE